MTPNPLRWVIPESWLITDPLRILAWGTDASFHIYRSTSSLFLSGTTNLPRSD